MKRKNIVNDQSGMRTTSRVNMFIVSATYDDDDDDDNNSNDTK